MPVRGTFISLAVSGLNMQKIVPNLWFEDNAEAAAHFYTSLFKDSRITKMSRYGDSAAKVSGRPKGSVLTVEFELCGQAFTGLNGGPLFKFSPAISFFVQGTDSEVSELFDRLSDGGAVLMPLDKYPFSEKFGWVNDKFGVSWQVMRGEAKQKITPFLLFVGEQHGRAEEAVKFYV